MAPFFYAAFASTASASRASFVARTALPFSRFSGVDQSLVKTTDWSGRIFANEPCSPSIGDQARGIGEFLVAELHHAAFRAGIELFDIRLAAQRLDVDELQQVLDLFGQRAEAIDQFRPEAIDIRDFPPVRRGADKAAGVSWRSAT
jgi:hypothetical protein